MSEAGSVPPRVHLLLVAAVAGAAVLGLEVLAARTMAPSIGSGPVAWSALLAVALGTLAGGNLLGGVLAERLSPGSILAWALAAAAIALVALSWAYPAAMRWAAGLPLLPGALAAAAVTQAVPMLMLGTVSPAIIAAGRGRRTLGRWSGAVLACGSAGGIAGSLAMGLAGLEAVGIARCILLVAASLALLGLATAIRARRWLPAGAAAAAIALAGACWLALGPPKVIQSRHGQIEVRRSPDASTLLIDGLPQTALAGPVQPWQGLRRGYLAEAALLLAHRPRFALVIGLGAGLAPRLLAAHGLQCESVEIDPAVVDVARREFDFQGPVSIADGRRYLARTDAEWDVIVVDVCTADRLPRHLFTAEALGLMRARLSAGGVVAIQFIGDGGAWSGSLVRTVRAVFGSCLLLAPPADRAHVGPRWILAARHPLPASMDFDFEDGPPWRVLAPPRPGRLLTDDHFPAERSWSRTARHWRRLYADGPD